jgi:D-specific alpha-keto acid dehydrogenase
VTAVLVAYGCTAQEAALFRRLAPRFSVPLAAVTDGPLTERNAALAAGVRCVSVGHKTPVTHGALRALSDTGVRYLSTRSIGSNHIDLPYAESVGVRVEGVSYSPDSVADHTLMLMLMAVRRAGSVLRRAVAGDYRLEERPGSELRDLTVGVVGTGRIGAAVVRRLRGFGCTVLTHDSRPWAETEHVPLDELLRRSDLVTLHVPLTDDTHHLLDRRRIRQLKAGAVVVNTARGGLIDTEALVAALEDGHLGGAALDVVEGEDGIFYADLRDRPVDHDLLLRLRAMPHVVITPHTAFHTDHALADMVENTLLGCLRFESGRRHG